MLEIEELDACRALYASMRASVEQRRGKMVMDDATRSHIVKAARWLTDTEGKFGLMMCGLYGNGKTTLGMAIAHLIDYVTERELGYSQRKRMKVKKAKEIASMCALASKFKDSRDDYQDLFCCEMLMIDDLGEEPKEVLNYGQPQTPVIDVLSERYDRQLLTVVTTNLTNEQLGDKYGGRMYDRFREMFSIIAFTNESYRK